MRALAYVVLAGLLGGTAALPAFADVLSQIRDRGSIRLGHRADAAPFSFVGQDGRPAGYSVELCRQIAAAVGDSLGARALKVEYVEVSASDRFEAIEGGRIDLLCEATTMTLARRERVDFSLLTFVTGASLVSRADASFTDLGQGGPVAVGVLAGTTTEQALRRLLAERRLDVPVLQLSSHDIAIAQLLDKQIDAYFADREILATLLARRGNPAALVISNRFLTYEPYAIALRKGEGGLRLIADKTLAGLYRSGAVQEIFARWFPGAQPSDALRMMYFVQAVPE